LWSNQRLDQHGRRLQPALPLAAVPQVTAVHHERLSETRIAIESGWLKAAIRKLEKEDRTPIPAPDDQVPAPDQKTK
jgi:hypothetical protein